MAFAASVAAGPFEDAEAAYDSGDFATAAVGYDRDPGRSRPGRTFKTISLKSPFIIQAPCSRVDAYSYR